MRKMANEAQTCTYTPRTHRTLYKHGVDVEKLRTLRRVRYFQALKEVRNHYADRLRNITSEHGKKHNFETLIDLKKFLYSQKDANYDANQLLEEITEVEKELLKQHLENEGEQYESDLENLINHSVENYCVICDKQVSEGNLCKECENFDSFPSDFASSS